MPTQEKIYPDISDIIRRKEEARSQRAALSLREKLDILDAMRERVEPIRRARLARNLAAKAK